MPKRPLTPGEIALAREVFGGAIDYATVTITEDKFIGFHPDNTAMAPDGNLYMPGCYRNDYSKEDTWDQAMFIHEMTHVWQYQNKILSPVAEAVKLNIRFKFDYAAAYGYMLDAKKDLVEYNMEQQASIVQDYFSFKKDGYFSYFDNRSQNICTDAERETLYEKVLENFLKDPGYAKNAQVPFFPGRKPPKPTQGPPQTPPQA